MRTIFIVMDSLNRNYLNCYGNDFVKTPNIDRLAARGVVFDNHWSASLPCMPARRDMMNGRYNFLEAPWGPIEPWDDCLTEELRKQKKTYSHMITDHYHYFHGGGEGYHDLFNSYEFERGQEGDKWHALVDSQKPPEDYRGKGSVRTAYWNNRVFMDSEDDMSYPTPRCFQRAAEFVENNHASDNWHLHLEVFDPHEPFDCPKKYLEMYNDTWDGPYYNWPQYAPLDPELDTPEAVKHIRKRYAGTLTMADYHLGKLLDKLDEHDMWKDTVVILTTDHGHLLGEHGYWAKNYMFDYARLANIPMIIAAPGADGGGRRGGLTSTIDIMPTLMNYYDAELPVNCQGKAFNKVVEADMPHNDAILFGYFGKDMNMFDGQYTYCRQPLAGSTIHHHTLMPRGFTGFLSRDVLKTAETGVFLDSCHEIPHLRITSPCHKHKDATDYNPIYDYTNDPEQAHPITDNSELEAQLAARMTEMLKQYNAPDCQYVRLDLNK